MEDTQTRADRDALTPGQQMEADFAEFERQHRLAHPAPVYRADETLDNYGESDWSDDIDPRRLGMHFDMRIWR